MQAKGLYIPFWLGLPFYVAICGKICSVGLVPLVCLLEGSRV
jgi:hypothetical protein